MKVINEVLFIIPKVPLCVLQMHKKYIILVDIIHKICLYI